MVDGGAESSSVSAAPNRSNGDGALARRIALRLTTAASPDPRSAKVSTLLSRMSRCAKDHGAASALGMVSA